jgi:hypothetical protein
MDCSSASAADRVADCGDGVQCPNERKPMFFMVVPVAPQCDARLVGGR